MFRNSEKISLISTRRSLVCLVAIASLFCTATRASAMRADSLGLKEVQEQPKEEEKQEGKKEHVAIKNNLIYDAAATPNIMLEILLAPKWSMELGVGFNPFPLDDTKFPKWRHIAAWIAPRYWFCNVFNRGFISINAAYAHYNVAGNAYPVSWMYKEVKDGRYQGDAIMAGASGGWHFPIKPYFSIELEGGIDAGYTWYKQYECKHCGDMTDQSGRWFILPKLAVNLVFPLGGDEQSLAKRCDCEKLETAAEAAVAAAAAAAAAAATEEAAEELAQATDTTAQPAPGDKERAPKHEAQAQDETAIAKTEPEQDKAIAKTEPEQVPTEPTEPVVPVVPVEPEEDKAIAKTEPEPEPTEPEYEVEEEVSHMVLSLGPKNGYLYFDVDVSKMDRSFLENEELMSGIMDAIGEILEDTTLRISHIDVTGFASFDGRLAYNTRLAGARAQTIKRYMQATYPQLADSLFTVTNGGESWTELRERLEKVEFVGRDEVFAIMDEEPDLEMRERKIKALHGGATYRYMRDELRHIMRNLGYIKVSIERK